MAAILVVDDLPEMQTMLEELLGNSGHTVVCASNGRQALALLAQRHFDLMISDIFMPEMDGIEFIRSVHPANPDLPIIAMSAGDNKGRHDSLGFALDFGAVCTFEKPFNVAEFLKAVEELTANKE